MSRPPKHTPSRREVRHAYRPQSGRPRPDRRTDEATDRGGRGEPDVVRLWGFHSVREALRSPRRELLRLYATAQAADRLQAELAARQIEPIIVDADALGARMPAGAVHQGLLLEARPLATPTLDELPGTGLLIVLDQVTDPHNVGAILRTAAAFDAVAVITTARHAPDMTGTLAKAASGGLDHVPVILVVNLARALERIGDLGYVRIGLDSQGAEPLHSVEPTEATALVLGAEGKGLRRLSRENCDLVARLDFPGPIKSLNVSNACAAALTMLHLRRVR